MADIYVRLPFDPTGRNPDNLVSGELHQLKSISGFPYKIIDLLNGGFYLPGVRVYDANYNRLTLNTDYILTYKYATLSKQLGIDICSAIVFLDKARTGNVYVSAQMVGGDEAFSLTVINDYIQWFNTQPSGYIPRQMDYVGNEPSWLPGELDKERWRLDTFQPFNNEIYQLSRAVEGGRGTQEIDFRDKVIAKYNEFLNTFTDRLQKHIDDKNNPHVVTKTQIGLGLVQNYKLATIEQSRQGVSNDLYQTPELSWQTIDALAVGPLNTHINNKSNPHKTTPAMLDSPTKTVVNGLKQGKYLTSDTVVNSSYLMNGTNPITYVDLYNTCRDRIPAQNFAAGGDNGLMAPERMGTGVPSNYTVLLSDGSWVDWSTAITPYMTSKSSQIKIFNFPASTTPEQAHNMAVADPWASAANVGSVMLYRLTVTYTWGTGGGTTTTSPSVVYGSYKTGSGWIKI